MAAVLNNNLVSALMAAFVFVGIAFAAIVIYAIISLVRIDILMALFGILLIVAYFIAIQVVIGTYLAIVAKSLDAQEIKTGQAISLGVKKILPLIGFYIMYTIATVIGYILLIVPGLIITARGSLGAILIFEENLGPIAAFKRSFALTKGHFFEALSPALAGALFCSGGLLAPAMVAVPMAARYKDFKIAETQATKQKVHWMNYLLPGVIIVVIAVYVGLIVLLAGNALSRNRAKTLKKQNQYLNQQEQGGTYNSDSNFNSGNSYKYNNSSNY